MKEKEKNYISEFRKTLLESKVEQKIRIEGDEKQTISSFLGVFNNDIAVDIIKCLLLKCFDKFKNDVTEDISNGSMTKFDAKRKLYLMEAELNVLLSGFMCSNSENMAKVMSLSDFQKDIAPSVWEGINPINLESKINNLTKEVEEYKTDVEKNIDSTLFKSGKSTVFELNSSVTDDQLRDLYRLLTDYKKDYSKELVQCTESDFIDVLRGKGKGTYAIQIIGPSALASLVNIFKKKGWFDRSKHKAFWEYLAVNFIGLDGKKWNKHNLSSNPSRNKSPEIENVFNNLAV
jgi:hypothetical protein